MFFWAALLACRSDPGRLPTPDEETPVPPACETALTWENFGKPLFDTWCNACHGSGVPLERRLGAPEVVALDVLEVARTWSDRVAERTIGATGGMPPSGPMPTDDLALLAEWIGCGMPGDGASTPDPCLVSNPYAGDLAASSDPCGLGINEIQGDLLVDADADLACLCAVGGDVEISEVTSSSLPQLETVGGSLLAIEAADLSSLQVPALASVGGDVRFEGLSAITALDLGHLVSVGGAFSVVDAPVLVDVDLSRLATVGGDLTVAECGQLLELANFVGLTSVGGDVTLSDLPAYVGAPYAGWDAMLRVNFVGGDIAVTRTGFEEMWAFQELEALPGSLRVVGNPNLLLVAGFQELRTVGGEVEIRDNPQLDALGEFLLLEAAGGVLLIDNPQLSAAEGFPALAEVGELVVLRNGLPTLKAFSLEKVLGSVLVAENLALTTVDDLSSLQRVGGDLTIRDNPLLPQAEAQAVADAVPEVGGATVVTGNQ